MKTTRKQEIVASLVFILLILICSGLELYFVEKASIVQAIVGPLIQLANLLIIIIPVTVLIYLILFLSSKYKQRKK